MRRLHHLLTATGLLLSSLAGVCSANAADQALIDRGAYLARAGDCEACHTRAGGKPYGGGSAIISPFGAIIPPNITPDKKAGIGGWSDDDFYRAMHEGVDNDGAYLYPAMPYPWYTKVTRDDVRALKAYLDTVSPDPTPAKTTRLSFPFDVRAGLRAWNDTFVKFGEFKPDSGKSPEWNRGAYLVEGLGHCGDCHTPKNLAMAPSGQAFSGGQVDDWYAPNITSDPTRGIGKWSEDDLFKYLKTGVAPVKGATLGPMAEVVHDSLAYLTDDDVRAMVTFLKTIPPVVDYQPKHPSELQGPHAVGAGVYLDYCSSCHGVNGQGRPGVPALAGNDLVNAKGPQDVIRVIFRGRLASGNYAPMPAVGAGMTDEQIRDVVDYVRNAWKNAAPVITQDGLVGEIRARTVSTLSGKGDHVENGDPCGVGDESDAPAIPDSDGKLNQSLVALKDETMLEAIPALITATRAAAPNISQAGIVNGLSQAYCKIEARNGEVEKPEGRRRLGRFSLLVYSELVSHEKE